MSAACYTAREIQQRLKMSASTFKELKRTGKLPFVRELLPRVGRVARYRADLVDQWLAGLWGQPRTFTAHRRAG